MVRQWFVLAALIVAIVLIFLVSMKSGYADVSFSELFYGLLLPGASEAPTTILQLRLPRMVLSLLCGMGLALSGCILQTITRNSLADPGILGINAGAGFMVLLFLTLFPALHISAMVFQPLFALAGGLIVAVILIIFSRRDGRIRPSFLILGGIGAAAGFTALMIILGSDMENNSYQMVTRWLVGDLWGTSWHQVLVLLPYLSVLVPLLFFKTNILDLLLLGDEASVALGVRIERERGLLLLIAVALAASCISVSGGISFIGLVSPHMAKRFVGGRHSFLLPASLLLGGLFLLLADTMGRTLFLPLEIPAGIIISLLAAPYFLFLLNRRF